MDRGTWRATLHRVIQSWAGLKLLSMDARTPKSELVYKWPGPQTILLSLFSSPWSPTDPGTWLHDFLLWDAGLAPPLTLNLFSHLQSVKIAMFTSWEQHGAGHVDSELDGLESNPSWKLLAV